MPSHLLAQDLLAPLPRPDPHGIHICNTELQPCGYVILASKGIIPWHDTYASTTNVAAFAHAWLGSPVNSRYAIIPVELDGSFHLAVNLTYGGPDPRTLRPAEVLRTWMGHQSLTAILVHTHSGSNLEPDTTDLEFTHELAYCASLIGMRLLDHIIIGNFEGFLSMKEKGFFD